MKLADLAPDPFALSPSGTRAGRRRGWLLAGLGAAALAALAVQGALAVLIRGGTPEPSTILRWHLLPAVLWLAAAPFIVGLGRRRPVRSGSDAPAALLHATAFGLWMVASNGILRLPDLLAGVAPGEVVARTVGAAVEHAPPASLLYLLLATLGSRLAAPTDAGDAGTDGSGAQGASSSVGEGSPATDGSGPDPFDGRLALRDGDRIHLLAPEEVRWIGADGDHVVVHAAERSLRAAGPLKHLARELRPAGFLRVHRSAVVNLAHVREFRRHHHGDFVAVLDDGTAIRVPRSRTGIVDRLRELCGGDI